MCFGGGGGGGSAAPTINFSQPISKQIAPPEPVVRTFKPLVEEGASAAVRSAGASRKRKLAGTPFRRSLSTGVSMGASGGNYPSGGINL